VCANVNDKTFRISIKEFMYVYTRTRNIIVTRPRMVKEFPVYKVRFSSDPTCTQFIHTQYTHAHTHTLSSIRVFVEFPQIFTNDLVTKIIFLPPFVLHATRIRHLLSHPPQNHHTHAHPVLITVSKHPFTPRH